MTIQGDEGQGQAVSTKWLLGILATIVLASGAGWMSSIQAQQAESNRKLDERSVIQAEQAKDIAVIKEQMRQIRERGEEQARQQAETNRKLDELREFIRSRTVPGR